MEIRYRTDQGRNKMILTGIEGFSEESFETRMLDKNSIPMLLPFSHASINESQELIYDISSRQMLKKWLEIEKLNGKWLEKFVESIAGLERTLEGYLLDISQIVFRLDLIYIDNSREDFYFCFCPGYQGNMHEEIKEVFNQFLPMADMEDEKTVRTVYSLNKIANRENFSISDLAEELNKKEEPIFEEDYGEPFEPVIVGDDYESPWEAEQPGLLARLRRYVKENNVFQILEDLDEGRFKEKLNEPRPEDKLIEQKPFKIMKAPEIKELGDIEIEDLLGGETMLIKDWENSGGYLEGTGNQSGKVIVLDKMPFSIGKSKDKTDETLNCPTVSRIHARFNKSDEIYYLEDMNSRNGTRLNGKALAPFSPAELKNGDRISFADQDFYYRQG
ncbi:MAG: FHA domain-containing protein [Lachnospiraceae bacterium]|nr:FHA domain-containing protein [Lachnospiraceae bacterium]